MFRKETRGTCVIGKLMQGLYRHATPADTARPLGGSCVDLPRYSRKPLAMYLIGTTVIASD